MSFYLGANKSLVPVRLQHDYNFSSIHNHQGFYSSNITKNITPGNAHTHSKFERTIITVVGCTDTLGQQAKQVGSCRLRALEGVSHKFSMALTRANSF